MKGNTHPFKINGKEYIFEYTLGREDHRGQDQVTIKSNLLDRYPHHKYDEELKHSVREDKSLSLTMNIPQSYMYLVRGITKALYEHILYTLPLLRENPDWDLENTKDDEVKKAKRIAFMNARRISTVLTSKIHNEWREKIDLTYEETCQVSKMLYRIYPYLSKGNPGSSNGNIFYNLKKRIGSELWHLILRDLTKYKTATARYILEKITGSGDMAVTRDNYHNFLKNIPLVIKKNKYNLNILPSENINEFGVAPQTRFQWFMFTVLQSKRVSLMQDDLGTDILIKLIQADLSLWHRFKDYLHIEGPYSCKEISHIIGTLYDGMRIYKQYKDNKYGIQLVPIKGSAVKMLRGAIFNHRANSEIQKKRLLNGDSEPMAKPLCELPEWMEKLRIKTTHEMIMAGAELSHCLGSYTNSNDIFFRDETVCLQWPHGSWYITQCFDIRDTITKKSQALEKKFNSALEKLRKEQEVAVCVNTG